MEKVNVLLEAELESSSGQPVPIFSGSYQSFKDQEVPIYRDDCFRNKSNS